MDIRMKNERQEKIRELERLGLFDRDIEDDPPSREINPDDIEYLNKRLIQRIKTRLAFFLAYRFANRAEKRGELIIKNIIGAENLALAGGAILTANHFSPLDSFIMHRAFDASKRKGKLYRIIKEGNYTSFPGFYGFLMRNCNTLPLSRNTATMRKLLRAVDIILKSGDCILIYPEQSLWYNYRKPKPLKIGAFDLAVRSGAPVVPAFITMEDTDIISSDSGEYVQKHTVHIGKPIYPDESLPKKERAEKMQKENFEFNKSVYERIYGIELRYETE